ncbi:MAG: YbaN family protein [Burkholderiales bacterium]|nr:YbaN family protein [Burkholderiales bacterium]
MRQLLWRSLALLSIALALAGVVLPVLPTVPFVLLAAWAAVKGWPALESWLLNHAHFGPAIRRWRDHGAVPRRAKWLASVMMTGSAVMLALTSLPLVAKIAVPAVMAAVAFWLWRRPEV